MKAVTAVLAIIVYLGSALALAALVVAGVVYWWNGMNILYHPLTWIITGLLFLWHGSKFVAESVVASMEDDAKATKKRGAK